MNNDVKNALSAYFLSNKASRLSIRAVQTRFKSYKTEIFGDLDLAPINLVEFFRLNVFNNTKSIAATSLLSGNAAEYLRKVFQADLDEIKSNAGY